MAARRILVVDDNVDAADTLALLLKMRGHLVATAYEGPAALEIAKEFQPDVVFLDIGMPGIDGYALARALREQDSCLHCVAHTGWAEEAYRRRSLEEGFLEHLVKPVDAEILNDLLTRIEGELPAPS